MKIDSDDPEINMLLKRSKPREERGYLEKGTTPKGGRPRKRIKYRDIEQATTDELYLLLQTVIPQSLYELAAGVKVLEYEGQGKDKREVVYRKPPNIEAIKVILDRTLGKPNQTVEHTVEHSGTVMLEENFTPSELTQVLEMALESQKRKIEDSRITETIQVIEAESTIVIEEES